MKTALSTVQRKEQDRSNSFALMFVTAAIAMAQILGKNRNRPAPASPFQPFKSYRFTTRRFSRVGPNCCLNCARKERNCRCRRFRGNRY